MDEKCTCQKCAKEFKPYKITEECSCEDGQVEMQKDWDFEPTYYTCTTCCGSGSLTWTESKLCSFCIDVYDEDYYDM